MGLNRPNSMLIHCLLCGFCKQWRALQLFPYHATPVRVRILSWINSNTWSPDLNEAYIYHTLLCCRYPFCVHLSSQFDVLLHEHVLLYHRSLHRCHLLVVHLLDAVLVSRLVVLNRITVRPLVSAKMDGTEIDMVICIFRTRFLLIA